MNILPLTTIEDVLVYPGMATISPADQEWINSLIRSFSVRAESYTSRLFYEEERTEQFSSDGTTMRIQLPAFGKSTNAVAMVKQSSDRTFGADTTIDLSNFFFNWRTGLLTYEYGPFVRSLGGIQVKWTGGLGTNVEHVPADLRAAATTQVVFWWQRRNEIGLDERRFKDGAIIRVPTKAALVADVEEVLSSYQIFTAS